VSASCSPKIESQQCKCSARSAGAGGVRRLGSTTIPEEALDPVAALADKNVEMPAERVERELIAHKRAKPVMASPQIHRLGCQENLGSCPQRQHRARRAEMRAATYSTSVPASARTRTRSICTSTRRPTTIGPLGTCTGRSVGGRGASAFCDRRSCHRHHESVFGRTPCRRATCASAPPRSTSADNCFQNARVCCFDPMPRDCPPFGYSTGVHSRTGTSRCEVADTGHLLDPRRNSGHPLKWTPKFGPVAKVVVGEGCSTGRSRPHEEHTNQAHA
jgi:hypothetical protein